MVKKKTKEDKIKDLKDKISNLEDKNSYLQHSYEDINKKFVFLRNKTEEQDRLYDIMEGVIVHELKKQIKNLSIILAGAVCKENPFVPSNKRETAFSMSPPIG